MFSYSAYINMFLGLFNMIPFPPLDGSKIFRWNPIIWAAVFLPFIGAFLFYAF
ncbi:MAG: site-2 protease family protein [Candidatus Diapherotrites archaeon]